MTTRRQFMSMAAAAATATAIPSLPALGDGVALRSISHPFIGNDGKCRNLIKSVPRIRSYRTVEGPFEAGGGGGGYMTLYKTFQPMPETEPNE